MSGASEAALQAGAERGGGAGMARSMRTQAAHTLVQLAQAPTESVAAASVEGGDGGGDGVGAVGKPAAALSHPDKLCCGCCSITGLLALGTLVRRPVHPPPIRRYRRPHTAVGVRSSSNLATKTSNQAS